MKPANFAPVYAVMYPELAEIARRHGYALAVHGSMARDFDLVAVPWIEQPSHPDEVVRAITEEFSVKVYNPPVVKLHGRLVYTVIVAWGECSFDLSFMPVVKIETE